MTSMSYEEIFSDFLGNVTDYTMMRINESDAYELMTEYLQKTIAVPYVARLFSSINMDTTIQNLEFELSHKTDEQTDYYFVKGILSKGMVVEWLKPQVRSKLNIMQMISGKEAKFYAQSAHIAELRGLLEDTELELRKTIRDRGYISNSYLEDV